MKTAGRVLQTGPNTLHIDDHHVHDTGHEGQFLLHVTARQWDTVTHHDLVGSAADAGQLNPLGPNGLGFLGQILILTDCRDDV